jgi:hypothetical protein
VLDLADIVLFEAGARGAPGFIDANLNFSNREIAPPWALDQLSRQIGHPGIAGISLTGRFAPAGHFRTWRTRK